MRSGTDSDERGGKPYVQPWKVRILLTAPRSAVAGATAALLFVSMAAVSLSPFSPLADPHPLVYVYGALIGGNLTLITVVVSINQLLVSRELMTPDELRSQIDGVIDYRQDVEESAGRVAPVEPMGFLRLLLESTRRTAQDLGGLAFSQTDAETADEIGDLVSQITRKVDEVDDLLQDGDASMFHVLSTTLDTNYAREINQLRRIDHRRGDRLPPQVTEWVEALVGELQNIDIARQYFKSVYLQQELATLSKLLFFTGLPSIAVVAAALFLFTGSSGPAVPRTLLSALAPTVVAVGLLPLTVLFAYILRTATVLHRTAAIVPFTAPAQER
ncbi:hypothetical protein ACFQE8_01510 [Salinirubellus sp. GCM10025818]|uniref:hypothetical protein n=1 Tax=Salinirubellus TaxID=2162630 RepID=UPI0030D2FC67